MAKALLGYQVRAEDRHAHEAARLRSRVRDLELLIDRLQSENDLLRSAALEDEVVDLAEVESRDVVAAADSPVALARG